MPVIEQPSDLTYDGLSGPLEPAFGLAGPRPRMLGVGTALPERSYTQAELLDEFRITDPKIRSVFLNSAIARRHLTLPPAGPDGTRLPESQGQLLAKHRATGLAMGRRALEECLADTGAGVADIRYLVCVTSTGFMTPGFSALMIREMGLRPGCARLDVVGMGCNAGLNGLTAVAGWAAMHPGDLAVLVCMEACSAAYVFDGTMRTSVVNSLFGDGAAALAVCAGQASAGQASAGRSTAGQASAGRSTAGRPELLDFASCIIPDAIGAMRYDWDDEAGKFSFFLDREVPYVVGAHAEDVIDRLLAANGVRRTQVAQWIIHSGGKKVIDSVRVNLGLTAHDLRHTTGVLRDYGNLSSGSFLFSYRRLLDEGVVRPGDYTVLMTMGPGSTIETALVRY
jgi:predicted naringenin-chalcone synthase